jgi:preprotein translocase subunit SecE
MFEKIRTFFREALQELKKVHWPSRQETTGSTIVVVVFILLTGVYLGVVDAIITWVMAATLN